MSSLKEAFDFHQTTAGELGGGGGGGEVLIPASLVFTHFVSLSSSSCLRAGKELVAFVARCRLSLAARQHAAVSCLFEGQPKCQQEDYRFMLPGCVGCHRFRLCHHPFCFLFLGSANT